MAAAAMAFAAPAGARDPGAVENGPPAAGVELWTSADSDDTQVVKLLGRAALRDDGAGRHLGFAIEEARFTPQGQRTRKDRRLYADLADRAGDKWLWKARVGSDGRTWLGSASLRTQDWSREVFLEREIVETPQGLDRGIYYTFVGASMDVPAPKFGVLNLMAGLQGFTGDNKRLHIRSSYVHVVEPGLGLSAQLRARYFHSTEPGESDYYSPRHFAQALPVVQMRRFTSSGWMVLGAAGYGAQRATGSSWVAARLVELRFESPRGERGFRAFGHVQYSNNSLTGAGDYDYVMARLGFSRVF